MGAPRLVICLNAPVPRRALVAPAARLGRADQAPRLVAEREVLGALAPRKDRLRRVVEALRAPLVALPEHRVAPIAEVADPAGPRIADRTRRDPRQGRVVAPVELVARSDRVMVVTRVASGPCPSRGARWHDEVLTWCEARVRPRTLPPRHRAHPHLRTNGCASTMTSNSRPTSGSSRADQRRRSLVT